METLDEQIVANPEPETADRPLTLLAVAALVGGGAELALHSWIVSGDLPGLGIPIAGAIIAAGLIRATTQLDRPPDATTIATYSASVGFAALTAIRSSAPLIADQLDLSGIPNWIGDGDPQSRHSRGLFYLRLRPVRCPHAERLMVRWFPGRGRDLRDRGSSLHLRRYVGWVSVSSWPYPCLCSSGSSSYRPMKVFGDAVRSIFGVQLPERVCSRSRNYRSARMARAGNASWHRDYSRQRSGAVVVRFVGPLEASTAMWLLNGLFAIFVVFQVFEAVVSYQASDVSYAQQALTASSNSYRWPRSSSWSSLCSTG